jgi:hypothetical protein
MNVRHEIKTKILPNTQITQFQADASEDTTEIRNKNYIKKQFNFIGKGKIDKIMNKKQLCQKSEKTDNPCQRKIQKYIMKSSD